MTGTKQQRTIGNGGRGRVAVGDDEEKLINDAPAIRWPLWL